MTQTLDGPAQTLPARQDHEGGPPQRMNMNAPARDVGTLKGLLEAQKDKLAMVLPKHLTPDRLMRVVLVAVSKSDLLQKCTVGSILQCVMTSAQLGLDCSGVLGSAYMVPFWSQKVGGYEAQLIPGYRGLIDLARRSGEIEDVTAHCVYKDDDFNLELGAEPKLVHRPNLQVERTDEHIVGAYMVAFLKGNTRPHVEFVPRADIEKVRKVSRGAWDKKGNPTGPWRDWFAEMCRKTAIRRGIKYLPMSVELAEALTLEDRLQEQEDARVVSAQTVSRTDGLLKKITSREVDSDQRFEPAPEALADIAAQDAAVDPPPPAAETEPDTRGIDAEPAQDGVPDVSTWEQTRGALAEAAMDAGLADSELWSRVNLWVLAHPKKIKGQEDKKTTPAERLALVEAVRNGFLGADGKIVTADAGR